MKMIKRIRIYLPALLLVVAVVGVFLDPSAAYAANCGGVKTGVIACNANGTNPITALLLMIVNFLAVGVGIAVVGGIIWGGIMHAASNGDPGKTKHAITIIVNSVVGLLLFMFMYAIINFLVPGGLFT